MNSVSRHVYNRWAIYVALNQFAFVKTSNLTNCAKRSIMSFEPKNLLKSVREASFIHVCVTLFNTSIVLIFS